MIKKYVFFLFICLIFQSCHVRHKNEFDETLNRIAQRTGREVESKLPFLQFGGMGGSLSDGIINHEYLTFFLNKEIGSDESIKLISIIIKTYLKNICSEKYMEGYLREHPFTYKNLKISLFIHDENNDTVYHPKIGFVTLSKGVISYRTVSKHEKHYYKRESYIEEPYEEAAKRLGVWYEDQ